MTDSELPPVKYLNTHEIDQEQAELRNAMTAGEFTIICTFNDAEGIYGIVHLRNRPINKWDLIMRLSQLTEWVAKWDANDD